MPRRFDAYRWDRIEETPQGGLRIDARPTSAGVFPYANADGTTTMELRHPDDVFMPESLRSLASAPVTDLHPDQPINPDNWRALIVGHASENIRRDGIYVACPLVIQDANEIRLIKNGDRKELSCGYSCEILDQAGTYEGQQYDRRQVKIRYNHIGIGPEGWGRHGSSVSIRLDANDAMRIEKQFGGPDRGKVELMNTIKIDGINYPADSEAAQQALDKLNAARSANIAALEKENAELKAKSAAETIRADQAEKSLKETCDKLKIATDPKTLHEAAKARADKLDKIRLICRVANKKLDKKDEEALATSSDTDLLTNAIKMMDPKVTLEGKSPETIAALFEVLFNQMMERSGGGAAESVEDEPIADEPGSPPPGGRTDGGGAGLSVHDARRGVITRSDSKSNEEGALAARKRHRQDSANAWQKPLARSKQPQGE